MKKIFLYLLTVLIFVACSTNEAKIIGNVQDPEMSGKTIYLKERINREWITIDSMQVLDGTFEINKTCDTAKIMYLICDLENGDKIRQAFVFEKGKIQVSIDSSGVVKLKGTAQNDLFQGYLDEKDQLYKKGENIFKLLEDSTLSTAGKVMQTNEMEKLEKDIIDIDLNFAIKNVNTLIGTHIFTSSFHGMSIIQKESIIKLMNDDTKKVARVQEIMASIEIEKKTSEGNKYTDFTMISLEGDSLSISDLVGKTDYVLIDFWASWCGPCMQALPELKDFYSKHKGPKLEILGVSLDDDMQEWKSTIKDKKIDWKNMTDLKGWKCEGAKIYAVNSIPATVLIDKEGKIVGRNLSMEKLKAIFEN